LKTMRVARQGTDFRHGPDCTALRSHLRTCIPGAATTATATSNCAITRLTRRYVTRGHPWAFAKSSIDPTVASMFFDRFPSEHTKHCCAFGRWNCDALPAHVLTYI
jgi:hypothetical protein